MATLPSYTEATEGSAQFQVKTPTVMASSSRFPQSFLLMKTSQCNLILTRGDENEASQEELYFVSHHGGCFSSKPDVVLHATASRDSPTMGAATFHSFSSRITLSAGSETVDMRHEGFSRHLFAVYIPQTSKAEVFEWKRSSSDEVRRLGAAHKGLKLVRSSSAEVVAVYASFNWRWSKQGRMAFVGAAARGELGGNFDLLAVISALALVESLKRSGNAAAAGAAAGGAAGGGGGC